MTPLTIAANQGALGGGEVMLLQIAEAAARLGYDVTVVGPEDPSETLYAATRSGVRTVAIRSRHTRDYLTGLRRWDTMQRQGLLWCNGLRPALATSGRPGRVVHLHQVPAGRLRGVAALARRGALLTVVPSRFVQRRVPGSYVLSNWTRAARPRTRAPEGRFVVGFLGRLSSDKGAVVACEAFTTLQQRQPDRFRLLLAGEHRFVAAADAARVRAAIAALGDDAVVEGWIDRADFFNRVDLAVFPSIAAESFGLVAAEAMAARSPFVVSDAGALPEVTGTDYPWTVRAGDAEALATSIEEAAAADWDPHLARSYERWVADFSPAAGQSRLAHILDRVEALR